MKTAVSISSILPKYLFWDMDFNKLDINKDQDIIIPRSLLNTSKDSFLTDIQKIEQFYSAAQIIQVLQTTKERISNEVCLLVAERYSIAPFYRFKL